MSLPLCSVLCVCVSWDIRDTPLGDALYECHVLDYDLVRQVRPPQFTQIYSIHISLVNLYLYVHLDLHLDLRTYTYIPLLTHMHRYRHWAAVSPSPCLIEAMPLPLCLHVLGARRPEHAGGDEGRVGPLVHRGVAARLGHAHRHPAHPPGQPATPEGRHPQVRGRKKWGPGAGRER